MSRALIGTALFGVIMDVIYIAVLSFVLYTIFILIGHTVKKIVEEFCKIDDEEEEKDV